MPSTVVIPKTYVKMTGATVSNKGLLQINFDHSFTVPSHNSTNYTDLVKRLNSISSVLRLAILPANKQQKNITFSMSVVDVQST